MYLENLAAKGSQDALNTLMPSITLAKEEKAADNLSEITVPSYKLYPEMDMPTISVGDYKYIGILTIPSINLELPIIDEFSYPAIKVAPARYQGSAYLNNMIICAHNYNNHFRYLIDLKPNDRIYFEDVDGNVFIYEVIDMIEITAYDGEILVSGEDSWDLSLFTCNYYNLDIRVVTRCRLIGED